MHAFKRYSEFNTGDNIVIKPEELSALLKNRNIDFYTGVPDSLLKNFCAYLTDNLPVENHIIASNEGGALSLAMGYHLATDRIPVVYMQNSGLGNIVNPLLSMLDGEVCKIPALLMIGWRGKPGIKDEPQHVKQGRVMLAMLDAMEIPYAFIGHDKVAAEIAIEAAVSHLREKGYPFALIVEKNTFDKYDLPVRPAFGSLSREQAIEIICSNVTEKAAFVATTGFTSRELFENREKYGHSHDTDLLCVGGMGHSSQIALGVALNKSDKLIVCLDGDGAILMHMGGMAVIAQQGAPNLIHIVFHNGMHESVGGQPIGSGTVDFVKAAKACGYVSTQKVETQEALISALKKSQETAGPHFIEIIVKSGFRKDLGRPSLTPEQNHRAFKKYLSG